MHLFPDPICFASDCSLSHFAGVVVQDWIVAAQM